jgi:hypothetical protein
VKKSARWWKALLLIGDIELGSRAGSLGSYFKDPFFRHKVECIKSIENFASIPIINTDFGTLKEKNLSPKLKSFYPKKIHSNSIEKEMMFVSIYYSDFIGEDFWVTLIIQIIPDSK